MSGVTSSLKLTHLFCVVLLCFIFNACDSNKQFPITKLVGTTMGTQWHIKLHPLPKETTVQQLQQTLKTQLIAINQLFSTYQPDSMISRFNRFESRQAFPVSDEFVTVVKAAQTISHATHGAFDITAAPLINLWGFGKEVKINIPTDAHIAAVKKTIGYQHLRVQTSPPALYKALPALRIDLSAIAKGYAVDQLALTLDQHGIKNYMVEIGGEIKLKGSNAQGNNWQIAIQRPDSITSAHYVIASTQTAIATSGDYQNYFSANGKRYSHTINPVSGKPIRHHVASVTVLHPSAMMADAYATALNVLGAEQGMAVAEQLQLAVYLLIREETRFVSKTSSSFPTTQ